MKSEEIEGFGSASSQLCAKQTVRYLEQALNLHERLGYQVVKDAELEAEEKKLKMLRHNSENGKPQHPFQKRS